MPDRIRRNITNIKNHYTPPKKVLFDENLIAKSANNEGILDIFLSVEYSKRGKIYMKIHRNFAEISFLRSNFFNLLVINIWIYNGSSSNYIKY